MGNLYFLFSFAKNIAELYKIHYNCLKKVLITGQLQSKHPVYVHVCMCLLNITVMNCFCQIIQKLDMET